MVWFGFYFSLSFCQHQSSCPEDTLLLFKSSDSPFPKLLSSRLRGGIVECSSLTQVSCLITLQSDFPCKPLAWQDALFEVISLHSRESTSSKTPFPSNPCCALVHQRVAGLGREEPTSALSLLFSLLVLNRDAFELKPRERAGDAIIKPLPILSVSTNLAMKLARAGDMECRTWLRFQLVI